MELVYLWVEDYKNIQKQRFNFSPKFECSYDEKTNKLTINEKEHIKDFFGENINVTAIVGENGSGKSSILEALKMIIEQSNSFTPYIQTAYILMTKDSNNTLSVNSNITQLENNSTHIKHHLLFHKFLSNLHFTSINFSTKIHAIYNENNDPFSYQYNKKGVNFSPIIDYSLPNIFYTAQLNLFNISNHQARIKNNFRNIFYPNKIQLKLNLDKFTDKDFIKYEKSIKKTEDTELLKTILNILYEITHPDKELFIISNQKIIDETIDGLREYILIDIIRSKPKTNPFKQNGLKYFTIEFNITIKKTDTTFIHLIKIFLLILNEFNVKYLEFDILGKLNNQSISFNHLSDGEKELISVLSLIESNILQGDIPESNYLVLLDETFNSFHPEWQKKIINYIIKAFTRENKKFHFIITSHSPFILSDLPKENVIFLQDGTQIDVNMNPFGANIHTLLSHGFFMKDGLMGEFAKGKIEDLINYINDKESDITTNDEAQKLLDIIGEPVIKNQLQRMLDSKRLSKVDKIDLIEQQIKQLQEDLEKVKK